VQIPLLVDQPHGRDAENAVAQGELVSPTLSIEMLRPGKLLLFDEAAQGALFVVQRNSDNLEAAIMQLFVNGFEVGELSDAWAATRRPVGQGLSQRRAQVVLQEQGPSPRQHETAPAGFMPDATL
jgi:hypothetical protein